MQSKYALWQDEEVALPHHAYMEIAKDLLYNASFRMKNQMIKGCMRNNLLFTDMIEDLMACVDKQQLINTVILQLEKLFPMCLMRNQGMISYPNQGS